MPVGHSNNVYMMLEFGQGKKNDGGALATEPDLLYRGQNNRHRLIRIRFKVRYAALQHGSFVQGRKVGSVGKNRQIKLLLKWWGCEGDNE